MDDKQAAEILIKLLEKGHLSEEEKEALKVAVGILSWTSLSKSRIKSLKEKKERGNQWQ